jgi:predicted AlkP superfamily pyrophosphatase or phosphodiesterase
MSVNYLKLHAVDVPVTDLDEAEDDRFDGAREPFDPLEFDYEVDWPGPDGEAGAGGSSGGSAAARLWAALGGGSSGGGGLFNYAKTASSGSGGSGGSASADSFELDDLSGPRGLDEPQRHAARRAAVRASWARCGAATLLAALAAAALLLIVLTASPFSLRPPPQPLKSNLTHEFFPTTLVVSLDGFHPHYVSARRTPALHQMMLRGHAAPYMVPMFPLLTFPNHWTLVTGLYPLEHGIVGNTFWDPRLQRQFVNTDALRGALDPRFWQGGEPLWRTAARQGVSLAVHMWPGSEVPGVGRGNGPLVVDAFNALEALAAKVDRVMGWLDAELKQRPQLILTYVPTVDTFGHRYGISGPELDAALAHVDDFVGLLLAQLQQRQLQDVVNLVVVSDHGMAPTSNDRLLFLDDVVDMGGLEHVDGWPLFGLRPVADADTDDDAERSSGGSSGDVKDSSSDSGSAKDSRSSVIDSRGESSRRRAAALVAQFRRNVPPEAKAHYHIYLAEDLPPEWHFGGRVAHRFDYRLAPVWVIPDVGYSITTHKQMDANDGQYRPRGVHGYNNTELLMRALFVAQGPYFDERAAAAGASALKIKPFSNTEVYRLICDTLGIEAAPSNALFAPHALFGPQNLLPHGWTDELEFPNVPFEVDHVVANATYDLLWKRPQRVAATTVRVSTNTDPRASMLHAATLGVLEHLPQPTDLVEPAPAPPAPLTAPVALALATWWSGFAEDVDRLGADVGELLGLLADEIGGIWSSLGGN